MKLLVRLPVKSVMRFKCVSKGWNHMISNAAFRTTYLSRHGEVEQPFGFFYHRPRPNFTYHGPSMRGIGPTKFINTTNAAERPELKNLDYLHELGYILVSSKGLLLLSPDPMSYYVYDFVSKKHVELPRTLKYSYVDVGFVCKEQHKQGSYHLSYKVVCIGTTHHEHMYKSKTRKLETYSSETGKWQISIMTAISEFGLGLHFTAKVIGGVFHWFEVEGLKVVVYNPDDSEGHVKLIELPSDPGVPLLSSQGFGGTHDNECLQFYDIYQSIDVWILKSKQEGVVEAIWMRRDDMVEQNRWILTHRIKMELLPSKIGISFLHPIAICPWNPGLIFMCIFLRPNEIVSYDQIYQ
ncbi:putative F-box protein At3g23950 [Camellia sinensis]|uniref:putative F-box protein At3g23950 n=1 Tax=Camellia sinensis TaxID=4442 RepID=UPI0010357D85|nr:putative F-box protein At3g23950 [Camellia sinensis]